MNFGKDIFWFIQGEKTQEKGQFVIPFYVVLGVLSMN